MPAAFAPRRVRFEVSQGSAADTASATHAAAVVTLAGVPGLAWAIDGILWSYSGSGTLAGGNLTVTDAGVTILDVDISAKGQDSIPYRRHGSSGEDVVITLADGGANVTGKVTVLGATLIEVGAGEGGHLDFSDVRNSGLEE